MPLSQDGNQISIEDMDSFIDALKYAQTLINTANSGADLSYDFLRTYDYYGTVRMVVANGTIIYAPEITISGYVPEQFYQYSEADMSEVFYKNGESITSMLTVLTPEDLLDYSLLTHKAAKLLSVLEDGNLKANTLKYTDTVQFDISTDDDNTLFPIEVYDSLYYKKIDTLNIGTTDWDINISLQQGKISKPKDVAPISMYNVIVSSGLSAENIEFESSLETRDEILSSVIREDGIISSNAKIPEEVDPETNISTLAKIKQEDIYIFGKEIELHLSQTKTDQEIKDVVDGFMEASGSNVIYTGEDMFLTGDQASMIAAYIYRKITGIKQSSIQL